MADQTSKSDLGLVVLYKIGNADYSKQLSNFGFTTKELNDPDLLLKTCADLTPAIVIVNLDLESDATVKLLTQMVKTSWQTYLIVISDLDEDRIHDRLEGLGILGRIHNESDLPALDSLINKFLRITGKAH